MLLKSVSTDDLGGGGRGRKRTVKAKGQGMAKANGQSFYHSVERLPTLTPFDEERICWLKVRSLAYLDHVRKMHDSQCEIELTWKHDILY